MHHSTQNSSVTPQNQSANAEPRRYVRPRANVVETAHGYALQVEVPGVNKAGLEITIENGKLTLTGHRAPTQADAELIHRESRSMNFRRTFELDSSIDAANIDARLEQGVLTLTLPKAEAAKPRRIEVSGMN